MTPILVALIAIVSIILAYIAGWNDGQREVERRAAARRKAVHGAVRASVLRAVDARTIHGNWDDEGSGK